MGGLGSGHFRRKKPLAEGMHSRVTARDALAGRVPAGFPRIRWIETQPPFGGVIRWMVCPVPHCGRRCRVLYLGATGYGCHQCLGLTYESRQLDRTRRAVRRAAKERRKVSVPPLLMVGGALDNGGDNPAPRWLRAGKRRWIHWRTFRETTERFG